MDQPESLTIFDDQLSEIEEFRRMAEKTIAKFPEKEAEIAEYQRKYLSPEYLLKRKSERAERAVKFWEKYDRFYPAPKERVRPLKKKEKKKRVRKESEDTLISSVRIIGGGKRSKYTAHRHRSWIYYGDPMEPHHRFNRGLAARNFRMKYKFVKGRKICISPSCICSWTDNCLDLTWVAVHGKESICMVTRRQDVDMTRVDPFYQICCTNQQTMCSYATTVISEVDCLPYDDDLREWFDNDLRERFGQSIEKPFGVVSLVPDTKKVHEESGHEASSAEYDGDEKATTFLKKKMNNSLAFTFDETIQTAISAYQHLCLEELKAEDIWVTTLRIAENLFEHMHIDQRNKHLAVISGGP